jgi:hypothetical protein
MKISFLIILLTLTQNLDNMRHTWFRYGTNIMSATNGYVITRNELTRHPPTTVYPDGSYVAPPGNTVFEIRKALPGTNRTEDIWLFHFPTALAGVWTGKVAHINHRTQTLTNKVWYSTSTNYFRYPSDNFVIRMTEDKTNMAYKSIAVDFPNGGLRYNSFWDVIK